MASINASTSGAGGLISTADATGILNIQTAGTNAVTVDASQNVTFDTNTLYVDATNNAVGIGTIAPAGKLEVNATSGAQLVLNDSASTGNGNKTVTLTALKNGVGYHNLLINGFDLRFAIGGGATEAMRIDSGGSLWVATGQYSTGPATSSTLTGFLFGSSGELQVSRTGNTSLYVNRTTNDGGLVSFRQDGTEEGSISVSGTTVSYNGGHLSRWSQWQNETGKPNVYRGTILESTNNMCEWEKDGEPLPNEQATKTIVSTTVASKAVAGVFDRYDEDDETNPYDFYVAQSGDFVIRIAQGVVVQNGDLLESAGDGTAKPQADDICRSSTVAKVTSNYVSATYEDGSYCVPCILMIG